MDYNKDGQPAQAYAVPQQAGQQYQQPYAGQPAQQAYVNQPVQQPYAGQPVQQPYGQPAGATIVAQPYNGPTAQQAVVGQPGQPQQVVVVRTANGAGAPQFPPPDYCCLAWLSCIFCCCPIGLFAIFISSSVKSKYRRGDFDGANNASQLAKKASIGAIIVGVIWQIILTVYETENVNATDDDRIN